MTKYIGYSLVAVLALFSVAATPPQSPNRLAQAIHSLNDLPRNWQGISGNAIELNTGSLLIDKGTEISRKELSNGFHAQYEVKGRLQIAGGRILQLKAITLIVNFDRPNIVELSISLDDPLIMGYSVGVRYDQDLNRYNLADFPVGGARNFVFSAPAN